MRALRPGDDAGYFHARAIEEQTAAQRATCAAARHRHEEMAAMYRFKEMFANRKPDAKGSEHPMICEFSAIRDVPDGEDRQADSFGNPASTASLNEPRLYTSA
jgi:hypothetical protein